MKILIVEDDKVIAEHLKKGLSDAGFSVELSFDGENGFGLAISNIYDVIIIDLMLPKMDGLSVLNSLRGRGIQVPILILSAKRSVEDKVLGLQAGGDDYLEKPFAFPELLARVRSLIRRQNKRGEATTLSFDDITMNFVSREVFRNGKKVELQAKEFALLEFFIRNKKTILTKTAILSHIWNYNFDPETNVVDVLVCRLRNKLDKEHSRKLIKTIRGVGYVLQDS